MKYKLIKWLEIFSLVLINLIPLNALLKFSDLYFPYVTSKSYYFRSLVEIIISTYLILMILTKEHRFKLAKISYAFIGFTIVTFICDLLGENFYQSFWSNSSRMDGLISQLHFLAFILVLPHILNTKQKWIRFFYIQAAIAIIVSILAILQAFAWFPVVSILRPDSLFGNPSYLSVYSLLNVFLSLYLFNGAQSFVQKSFLSLLTVLSVSSMYLAKTRSSYLALAVGLACLVVIYVLNEKKSENRKLFFKELLTLGALSGFFVLGLQYLLSLKVEKAQVLLERLTDPDSIYSRFYFWQASLTGFLKHPLLGYGEENYLYLSSFYNPKMFSEPWFDRSHNLIIDLLVNFGILGLLAFLVFVGSLFLTLKKSKYLDLKQKSILTAAIVGYYINNLFLFEFLSGQILFLSFVSYICFYEGSFPLPCPVKNPHINFKTIFFSGCVFVIGLTAVFQLNIRNILANNELKNILEKKEFYRQVEGGKEIVFQKLLNQNLFATDDVRQNMIQASTMLKDASNDTEVLKDVYRFVSGEIQNDLKNDSKNIYKKYMAAVFYAKYQNFQLSESLYEEALAISPKNQEILISQGTMYLSKADYAHADQKFQLAYDLENNNPKARLYLIASSSFKKDFQKAQLLLDGFSEKQIAYKFDSRIIESFVLNGRNDLALAHIEKKCNAGLDCSRDYLMLKK